MAVVCDLTRHEGQQAVQVASNHINAVRVLNKGSRALPGVLIGNKTDLEYLFNYLLTSNIFQILRGTNDEISYSPCFHFSAISINFELNRERRKVSTEQMEGFASQQGLAYFETSASDSMTSCQEPFEHIARDFHNKFNDQLKLTASGTLQV